MKKILSIVILFTMICLFSGCNNKVENKTNNLDNNNNSTSNEKTINKIKDKQIICKSNTNTSGDEISVENSMIINFVNDNATTIDMIFDIKLLNDSEQYQSLFNSYTKEKLEESYETALKGYGINAPEIDASINDISSKEKEIKLSFEYSELIKMYAQDHDDADKYSDTSFDNVYNYAIEAFKDDDSLTCTYNGKVID